MNDFDLLRPAARQRTSNGRRRPARRRIAYTLTSNLFTVAPCLAKTAPRPTIFTVFEGTSEIQWMIVGRAVTGLDVR